MKDMTRKDAGFTLIELTITILIVGVGFVGFMQVGSVIAEKSLISKQQSQAIVIGQTVVEELRDIGTLTTTTGMNAYNDIQAGTRTVTGDSASYNVSWTVNENTLPAYKTIDLTVTWTLTNGNDETITLSSIVARLDPAFGGYAINN